MFKSNNASCEIFLFKKLLCKLKIFQNSTELIEFEISLLPFIRLQVQITFNCSWLLT